MEAIKLLSLSNPLAADKNTFAPSEEPCGDGASYRSVDVLDVLKEAAARSHSDSLRHRQVQRMLREEEKKRSVQEEDQDTSMVALRTALGQSSPSSLRHRQLSHVLENRLQGKERLKKNGGTKGDWSN